MLLDPCNYTGRVVGQSVDIEFSSLLEKFIDQNRAIRCKTNGRAHVLVQTLLVIHDCHRSTAEHITGTHQNRITDAAGYGGSNVVNGSVEAEQTPWHDQPFSADVTLPPLGVVWLVPEEGS